MKVLASAGLCGIALALCCAVALAAKPAKAKKAKPPAASPTANATTKSATRPAVVAVDPKGIEFFEKKIRPVLSRECYECHSAQATKLKGELLLDTREGALKGGEHGPAVVPGDVKASWILKALRHEEDLEMPFKKPKLSDAVIADFVQWIEIGAPDPRDGPAPSSAVARAKRQIDIEAGRKFWSFQKPVTHKPPVVSDANWPRGDIDRFVLAKLDEKGLKPVGDADRVTLCRRLYLDLIGLPPTPAEMDAFLQSTIRNPQSAIETLVDRLLASPRFGERWGRHWLDVARYAESAGKEQNVPYAFAWRYRDWVIDAVNADMPYDRFIVEQLAGDLLPAKDPAERDQHLIATGFLAIGPKGLNEKNPLQYEMEVVDEQIDATSRAFLATTAACARCHDHKFDPIPTTDYYALAGIFRSTAVFAGVARKTGNNGRERDYLKLDPTPARGGSTSAGAQPKSEVSRLKVELELEADRADLDRLAHTPTKGPKAKEHMKELAQRIKTLEGRIQSGQVYAEDVGGTSLLAMGVADEKQPADSCVFVRGEVEQPGPVVRRGFLSVMTDERTPPISAQQSGRLELARWIASRDNPLTARVMVNRVWHHLFGSGIVPSIDDFGAMGERPSHPELLDALAVEFANDWSVKKLIRRIVLSHAYQLSSDHNEANYAVDPENRLHWRMSRRRLDAEVIRDSVLAIGGSLDLSRPVGSPLARLGINHRDLMFKPADIEMPCRSVYLPLARGVVPEMLAVFDMADPSMVIGQREVTTVPTQALYMMNSPFVMKQARSAAQRLIASNKDDAARADAAYRFILCRPSWDDERASAVRFVREMHDSLAGSGKASGDDVETGAWTALCQVLFASADFRYVY